ncbi:MAG: hypothetical protein ACRDJI_08470 [Actinomycetota bacterium]
MATKAGTLRVARDSAARRSGESSVLLHPRALDALMAAFGRSVEARRLDGWQTTAEIGRATGARV